MSEPIHTACVVEAIKRISTFLTPEELYDTLGDETVRKLMLEHLRRLQPPKKTKAPKR